MKLSNEEKRVVRNHVIATLIVVVVWLVIGVYYNIDNQQSTTTACGNVVDSTPMPTATPVLEEKTEVVLGDFVPAERQEGVKRENILSFEKIPEGYKCVEKKKLIAQHSISYCGSSADRNVNLAVAAKLINGEDGSYLLKSGMTFSFLETVGEPTYEKGFRNAPIIRNRRHAMGVGGGICQVSSVTKSGICAAGIPEKNIISQKHSKRSAYINVKRGDKEATVSYDSKIDLKFKNSLGYPIRIKIIAKGNTVTAKVYKVKYVLKKKKGVK